MHFEPGGSTGVDDALASNWDAGIGAEIMGRNKIGPQRGPWADHDWQGWWGGRAAVPCPGVRAHPPSPAVDRDEGRHDLDVRIGGGPSTVREYLAADLIDHMHIVVVPIILGRGERLWDGFEGLEERFAVESVTSPSGVTHITFTRGWTCFPRLLRRHNGAWGFAEPEAIFAVPPAWEHRGVRPLAQEVRMPDVPSDPKDVLRRFFATLSSGDFDAIGEFFGDDSVWMVNDVARGFPSERGRRAIIEDFLQPVREGLFEPGDPKVEVVRMIGEGDWVVAETVGRGKLRNGNKYENSYVFVAQISGDQVTFLREYMDTAYAHDISEGSAQASPETGDRFAVNLRRLGH
jgi:ketosteroid isomerase-like protein